MFKLHEVWDRAGIKLVTPGSAVRHASIARQLLTALRGPKLTCLCS